MAEHRFNRTAEIRQYGRGSTPEWTNAVRVCRHSPDRVMLQIRGERSFATVTLPFDVAEAIAKALVQETQS